MESQTLKLFFIEEKFKFIFKWLQKLKDQYYLTLDVKRQKLVGKNH